MVLRGSEWRDARVRLKVAALVVAARDIHPDTLRLWTDADWCGLADEAGVPDPSELVAGMVVDAVGVLWRDAGSDPFRDVTELPG